MNRGGIIGADWELDDRMTAYDADHVEEYGLDGGKVLLRIDETDAAVARTIESVAAVTTSLADRRLMCLVEPLPYLQGRARPRGARSVGRAADQGRRGRVGSGVVVGLHLAQDPGERPA